MRAHVAGLRSSITIAGSSWHRSVFMRLRNGDADARDHMRVHTGMQHRAAGNKYILFVTDEAGCCGIHVACCPRRRCATMLTCYPGRIPPALRGKKSRMRTQRSACPCQVTNSRHSYDTLHGSLSIRLLCVSMGSSAGMQRAAGNDAISYSTIWGCRRTSLWLAKSAICHRYPCPQQGYPARCPVITETICHSLAEL